MTVHEIIRAAEERFGLEPGSIVGRRRTARVARARLVAMRLARDECDLSYPQLGKAFHRDHSTVLVQCRSAALRLLKDPQLWDDHEAIRAELRKCVAAVPRYRVAV